MPEAIRPEFVRGYHNLVEHTWAERHRLIATRDAEHQALNAEYGSAGISRHIQADEPYDRRYEVIEADFRWHYDTLAEMEETWKSENGMTIPESLFLDNFSFELKKLCSRPDFDDLYYFTFIRAKAEIFLSVLKSEFTFAGMQHRVRVETGLFPYAVKRCRTRFAIRPWHVGANRQIATYRNVWLDSLHESLGNMSAA